MCWGWSVDFPHDELNKLQSGTESFKVIEDEGMSVDRKNQSGLDDRMDYGLGSR